MFTQMRSWLCVALHAVLCLSAYTLNPANKHDFDYIIIGGGTSGIPVATRLAAAGFEVAVIEAGGFYEESEPIRSVIPAFVFQPNKNDWGFQTVPQVGLGGRELAYPQGKCIGGSSARNAMIYQTSSTGSYQLLANLVGDQTYTFDKMKRFFRNSITFSAPSLEKRAANATPGFDDALQQTTKGPVPVTYANWAVPFSSWIRHAMAAIGIDDAGDFDSGKLFGSQYFKHTISHDRMERAASDRYLQGAQDVESLSIFTNALAEKINFNQAKKATSVDVSQDGYTLTLHARSEIILSAGAFLSPQLLMLSGVGPRDQLAEFGIPVVHENPFVGQNMIDHFWFGITYRVAVETASKWDRDRFYLLSAFKAHQEHQTGPLTSNGGDFAGFEKFPVESRRNFSRQTLDDLSWYPEDYPEIEYITTPTYLGDFRSPQPNDDYQYATVAGAIMAPISRGNITLQSSSARDLPLINPNIFTSPTDREVSIAAFKRIRQMFQTKEMSPILQGVEYYPGDDIKTDEEILEHLISAGDSYHHPAGTCAMGDASQIGSQAVVDSRARVIGVHGLRVVDASILPFLIPSHIQSALYAIAEKIAEDIIADGHGKHTSVPDIMVLHKQQ